MGIKGDVSCGVSPKMSKRHPKNSDKTALSASIVGRVLRLNMRNATLCAMLHALCFGMRISLKLPYSPSEFIEMKLNFQF